MAEGSSAGVECTSQTPSTSSSQRSKQVHSSFFLMTKVLLGALLLSMLINVAGASKAALSPDGQCQCSPCTTQSVAAVIGYYSDENCQNILGSVAYLAYDNSPSGCASCEPAQIPGGPSVFARFKSGNADAQTDITRDQTCPPGSPAAVIATINAGSADCVQLQGLTGEEGAATYPVGGGVLPRRSMELEKRSSITCSGFTITSQESSYSPSVATSVIVNCQDSAAPCAITDSDQHTSSVTSSYTVSAGVDVFGITASVTFGQDYTDSEATTIQESVSIPVNQEGYLSSYSEATLYSGTFTGCSSGGDQAGEALALKAKTVTYALVLTNG
ncbi:hypothetical protein CBS101457_002963 [Exobasidium rhododendri]|nr:hypothetical protein CBS101457_002963 [Exobasidium rhododendri]